MKKIIVGFSSNKKMFSWLIRKFTDSNISHTYVRIPVPEMNTSIVFHAQGLNVHYINYEHFLANGNTVEKEIEVEVSEEQWFAAEKMRVFDCGKPYSYKLIIGYLWVLLGKSLGKTWNNPLADESNSYVCVELVAKMLGIPNSETMTPQDLLDYLSTKHS